MASNVELGMSKPEEVEVCAVCLKDSCPYPVREIIRLQAPVYFNIPRLMFWGSISLWVLCAVWVLAVAWILIKTLTA